MSRREILPLDKRPYEWIVGPKSLSADKEGNVVIYGQYLKPNSEGKIEVLNWAKKYPASESESKLGELAKMFPRSSRYSEVFLPALTFQE